jgi:hypothetical protein
MPPNTEISKVRIILPAGKNRRAETLRLEDMKKQTLADALKAHFLRAEHIPTYTALYTPADDGTVNVEAISTLLAPSSSKTAKSAKAFHGQDDLDSISADIMTDIRAKLNSKTEFVLRDEDESSASCDCTPGELPRDVLKVQAEVSLFLLDRGKTEGEKKVVISGDAAKEWVNTKLKSDLKTVVGRARNRNQIYHEPHHDLTPGILLLDEIFRRMVKEVDDKVREINKQTKETRKTKPDLTEPNLTELQEFVNGLAILGKGRDSEKYGAYIHKPGDFACPCRPKDKKSRFHVDPSRIELILDGEGHICRTAIKIGGWKGGTHSSGHTG